MDCSNPIDVNDRQKVGEVMEEVRVRLRQDLAHVDSLIGMEDRHYLGSGRFRTEAEVKAVLQRVRWPDVEAGLHRMDLGFLQEVGEVPVCSLTDENGRPLHPPTINQVNMKVSVLRVFRAPNKPKETLALLARVPEVDTECLVDASNSLEYSYGTRQGFVKRLEELTSRKCVGVGKGANKRLRKLLPYDDEQLVDWNQPIEGLLLNHVEVTRSSSAGAPTWAKKGVALEKVMQEVMPLVIGNMSKEGLAQLRAELPELFLCEVKNKLDRYERARLDDKTRPYIAQPLHFSLLFSFLSQNFTKCLKLCHEQGHNAYGLAYTKGRLTDLYEEKLKRVGRDMFFMAYGDDMDLFFRREGVLYRISPDCRQMDGSVDEECGKAVINYVVQAFRKRWGPSPFWEAVAKLWLEFSFDPTFLVSGTMAYRKKQKDGLMSGAVGTTLFDTAKALLSAELYADACDNGSVDPFDKNASIAFFKKLGLEIKPETWKPEVCNEQKQAGTLFGRNKFLGVRWMWWQGEERMELVPSLETDEWLRMLAVPRDHPQKKRVSGGGPCAISHLAAQRVLFDRCRGLLVTGAVFNAEARSIIHGVIDQIPGTPIVMGVVADGGRGEKPEEALFLGEFSFSNASGVPTLEGITRLYSRGGEGAGFEEIFPRAAERLHGLRRMPAPILLKRDDRLVVAEEEHKNLPAYHQPVDPGYSNTALGKGRPKKNVEGVLVDRKEKAATFEQMLDSYLGDDEAVPVAVLCERMAVDPGVLYPRLIAMGLAMSAREGECYVSKFPQRESGEAKRKEKLEARTAVISTRTSALAVKLKKKALERPAELAGVRIEPQHTLLSWRDPGPVLFEGELSKVNTSVQQYFSRNGYAPFFKGGQCIVDGEQWTQYTAYARENVPNATNTVPVCVVKARTKRVCQYGLAFACAMQADKYVELGSCGLNGTRTWVEEMEFEEAKGRQEDILQPLYEDTRDDKSNDGDKKPEEEDEQEDERERDDGPDQGDGGGHPGRDGEALSTAQQAEEEEGSETEECGLWGDSSEEEGAACRVQDDNGRGGHPQEVPSCPQDNDMVENACESLREVPMAFHEADVETSRGDGGRRPSDPGDAVGRVGPGPGQQDSHRGPDAQQNTCGVGGWGASAPHNSYGQAPNPQVVYGWGQGLGWRPWPGRDWCLDRREGHPYGGALGGIHHPYVWNPRMRGAAPWSWGAPSLYYPKHNSTQDPQKLLQSWDQAVHSYPVCKDGLSGAEVADPVRESPRSNVHDLRPGGEVGGVLNRSPDGCDGSLSRRGDEVAVDGQTGGQPNVPGDTASDQRSAGRAQSGRPKNSIAPRERGGHNEEAQRLENPRRENRRGERAGFCRGKPCPGGTRCRCEPDSNRPDSLHRGPDDHLVREREVGEGGTSNPRRKKRSGGHAESSRDGADGLRDRLASLESKFDLLLSRLPGSGNIASSA
nr:MAG: RNA-dependent RNA polymerase [Jingmen rodent permutotetravirus 1]